MKKIIGCLLICVFTGHSLMAQEKTEGYTFPAVIVDGDTIACITTRPVIVVGFRSNRSKQEKKRYTKLVRNVMKVYPYAKIAAQRLKEYDEMLAMIPNKNQQQLAMKSVEKQIRQEFQKDIEHMTYSQGIILIKLIDRETSKTSYKIIYEFRGKMRAFFYQSIAKMFKYDLKTEYDPGGSDKEIEKIVQLLENDEI